MFIELHMLQNFAPSNLNRDDTGNPKDCEFGGVRRARVSSQCLKRAIRSTPVFGETTAVANGVRTKRVVGLLADRFPAEQREKAAEMLAALVGAFLSKMDSKNKSQSAVLLYLSKRELDAIQATVAEHWDELADSKTAKATVDALGKELARQFKDRSSAPDIALFGRMLAENPELNVDAACQVAHAISTHRVAMEMDFYTAVDELRPEDTAGAGMMGLTGFDSACFYRYARLDWEQLVENLGGDAALARRTVEGFLRAALEAVPTGKQNGFAAQNPPSLAFAVVRSGGPGWSLANAFEKPVQPGRDSGLVQPSVAALGTYWSQLSGMWGGDSVQAGALLSLGDLPLDGLSAYRTPNVAAWIDRVFGALPQGGEV